MSTLDEMVADLRAHGYVDIEEHKALRVGTRVHHIGERWVEALTAGTGVVVALLERPDSPWSRDWHMADIELVVQWDNPKFGVPLSQLAQYHVRAVPTEQGVK